MALLQAAKIVDNEVHSPPEGFAVLDSLRARGLQLKIQCNPALDFIKTLYLFTRADISTFTIPTVLFALFGALSGTFQTQDARPGFLMVLMRIPSIILHVWSNLLVFNIANQRLPDAILEDTLNKPSRPLPSGKITATQSRRLLLLSLPIVLALSFYLGPWQETLSLFSLTWMYNDLKGCDEDFIIRNLLIAIGYGLYNSSALRIACGIDAALSPLGMYWIVIIGCVIFTTEHICDMKDRVGDKARGRCSAPLVLGDDVARWTIAVPVIVWSIACPLFFGLSAWGYLVPVSIGFIVAARTLFLRSVDEDAVTWKIWALWTVALFSLPLVKEHTVLTSSFEYAFSTFCIGPGCLDSLNLVGVSSVAMLLESRRLRGYVLRPEFGGNQTLIEPA